MAPIAKQAEVIAFLVEHHYAKGCSKASLYRHGLYRADTAPLLGDLMGVAAWLPPLPGVAETVGEKGKVLVLSRLCVHPDVPKNGASFFLAASMRMIDRQRWPTLLTYADTSMGHTGSIYKATNWKPAGVSHLTGNLWIDEHGMQRGRKAGDTHRTADEMRALGFKLKKPAPKLKFVHEARAA